MTERWSDREIAQALRPGVPAPKGKRKRRRNRRGHHLANRDVKPWRPL